MTRQTPTQRRQSLQALLRRQGLSDPEAWRLAPWAVATAAAGQCCPAARRLGLAVVIAVCIASAIEIVLNVGEAIGWIHWP